MRREEFALLVDKGALLFRSADSFADQWEGSYTRSRVQRREDLWERYGMPADARITVRELANHNRRATFVNCWSWNECECALMWQAFGQDRVAVQSTGERLLEAVPNWVWLVPVRYIDHDSQDVSENHSLDVFGWKAREYEAEREWRLIVERFPPGHEQLSVPIQPRGKALVEADVDRLVESVVTGPKMEQGAADSVRELLAQKGLTKPVMESRLNRSPYH
jgi:hypothetical protein